MLWMEDDDDEDEDEEEEEDERCGGVCIGWRSKKGESGEGRMRLKEEEDILMLTCGLWLGR